MREPIYVNRDNGKEIMVVCRGGKPVVTKKGFVQIRKGDFKHCQVITEDIFEENFYEKGSHVSS